MLSEIRKLESELQVNNFNFNLDSELYEKQLNKRYKSLKYIKELRKDLKKRKEENQGLSLIWFDKWVNKLTTEYFIQDEEESDDENDLSNMIMICQNENDYVKLEEEDGGNSFTNQ